MLTIVEVFKEYRNFLLGAQITIYTDHKNLLSNATVNDRVFRWETKIQEFGSIIMYIKGQRNIEADALSRLPTQSPDMESMLNHPPFDPSNPLLNKNPLDLRFVKEYQEKDHASLKALREDQHFSRTSIRSISLIQYKHGPFQAFLVPLHGTMNNIICAISPILSKI